MLEGSRLSSYKISVMMLRGFQVMALPHALPLLLLPTLLALAPPESLPPAGDPPALAEPATPSRPLDPPLLLPPGLPLAVP
ncbi:hypothetical protein, partial [Teichococcus cervicalis]|uniref:hypothetical protein n=1 Tax=Teichococcus cervicalis TaxID=204525 RepID=UPI0038CD26E6